MDYIGSKKKILDWIFKKITNNFKDVSTSVFLDGCAGTGIVSYEASNRGFDVISNDLLSFSNVVVDGMVNVSKKDYEISLSFMDDINNIDGIDGYFFKNLSESAGRLFFTNENAKKIDAIRCFIDKIENKSIQNYLLYCAIESISDISNTMGVYEAFKKEFKPSSLKDIVIKPRVCNNRCNALTYNMNILDLIDIINKEGKHIDVLYLDPPYNFREYGPNYHIYETFVKNDNPEIKIKKGGIPSIAGLRANWKSESGSAFTSKRSAKDIFVDILKKTHAQKVYISYNSDGLINIDSLQDLLLSNTGVEELTIHTIPNKRYKSDSSRNNNNNLLKEYLIEATIPSQKRFSDF